MSEVSRFWCNEAKNIRCVRESDFDALQRRLTEAESFVQKMVDCTKGQDSIATGYLSDILDVLKGNK